MKIQEVISTLSHAHICISLMFNAYVYDVFILLNTCSFIVSLSY